MLVDTTPDLRAQALAYDLDRVDAILFTHCHADHVMGLDDVRRFNAMQRAAIPCYGDRRHAAGDAADLRLHLRRRETKGGGIPRLNLCPVGGPFSIGGETSRRCRCGTGSATILGFRVRNFAYLTDCSGIPDASWPLLEGLDTLAIDALRHRPHPTHFTVEQALGVLARLGPPRTWLTHICHDLPHAATNASLPAGVELAYDGLRIDI